MTKMMKMAGVDQSKSRFTQSTVFSSLSFGGGQFEGSSARLGALLRLDNVLIPPPLSLSLHPSLSLCLSPSLFLPPVSWDSRS